MRAPGRGARALGGAVVVTVALGVPPATAEPATPPAPVLAQQAPASSGAPLVHPIATSGEQQLPAAVTPPQVQAQSYLLADAATGQVLANRNGTQPRTMASTTKVMTGLLVLEHLQLEAPVTVKRDLRGLEGVGLELRAGERFTAEQLLTALLVRSANDAAVALAEAVDGSVAAFVQRMNARARQLGLTDTHYANPHGLDAPGHHTTTRDLARLWATAMTQPKFRELVATEQAQVPGSPAELRTLVNTNELLGVYPWVEGGKTGFTDAAGRCLVVSAERGGRELIAVVLDSPDSFPDVRALLEYGFGAFTRTRLAATGDSVDFGARGTYTAQANLDALVRRDLLDQTRIALTPPAAAEGTQGLLTAGEQVIGPLALEGSGGGGASAEAPGVVLEARPMPPGGDSAVIDPFLVVGSQGDGVAPSGDERAAQRGG